MSLFILLLGLIGIISPYLFKEGYDPKKPIKGQKIKFSFLICSTIMIAAVAIDNFVKEKKQARVEVFASPERFKLRKNTFRELYVELRNNKDQTIYTPIVTITPSKESYPTNKIKYSHIKGESYPNYPFATMLIVSEEPYKLLVAGIPEVGAHSSFRFKLYFPEPNEDLNFSIEAGNWTTEPEIIQVKLPPGYMDKIKVGSKWSDLMDAVEAEQAKSEQPTKTEQKK